MNYWGKKDTSVSFCEDAYSKNMYIAEYYNTLSGSFYICVALPFLNTNINNIAVCCIFLGIGTICLHSTQRYYGQIMDETAMITLCYLILNKINEKKYQKKILPFILLIYIQNYKNFIIFIFFFTSCILCIVNESKNIKSSRKKFKRNLFLASMSIATFLWLLDQHFCKYVKEFYLHAFWHYFTSIGIASGFTLLNI